MSQEISFGPVSLGLLDVVASLESEGTARLPLPIGIKLP